MAIKQPWLLLLGFLVAVVYVPGWSGAAIPTGYTFLMIVISLLLIYANIRITSAHLYGSLFLLYAFVSLLWAPYFNISFFTLLYQIVLLGLIFCYGSSLDDLRPIIKGLALGLGVSAVVCLLQWNYNYKEIVFNTIFVNYTGIAGLFVNGNVLCEVSVVMLLALIVYKLYWWIPVTLPGILIIHSRAAVFALITCCFVFMYRWSKKTSLVLVPVGLLAAYIFYMFGNLSSFDERIAIYIDTFRGLTFFGNGAGSYELMFPSHATLVDTTIARPRYAHNDLLHLVYEFGVGTLLLISLIWNVLNVDRDERVILYGFGVISLFAFPLFIPMLAFIACLVAGHLTRYNASYGNTSDYRRSMVFVGNKEG